MPLNCTLQNGDDGQFYVCLTIKKKKKTLVLYSPEPERPWGRAPLMFPLDLPSSRQENRLAQGHSKRGQPTTRAIFLLAPQPVPLPRLPSRPVPGQLPVGSASPPPPPRGAPPPSRLFRREGEVCTYTTPSPIMSSTEGPQVSLPKGLGYPRSYIL